MTGERAERFVVLNLRLMAIGFAITGFFFIAWPDGTLDRITELGHHFGFDTPAPKTEERLWLSLGFAYMTVITFLAWIASTDVVRYRPMILALAADLLHRGRRLRLPAQRHRGRLARLRLAAALVARRPGRLHRRPSLKAPAGAPGRRAQNSASDRGGNRPW
jgi:hypothetical protein